MNKEQDDFKEQFAKMNGFDVFRIKSEWTSEHKFNVINKIIYEKIQIINPNWGTI
jgi:hypothetical protein